MRLPLILPVVPSPTLLVTLSVAHGVALLAALATDWPVSMKALVAITLVFSAWRSIRSQTSRLHGTRPTALGLKSDGNLDLYCRHGDAQPATVSVSTTVFPWLIILRLKTDTERLSLCLPRDAIGLEGHRQLRLWLTWLAKTE